MIAENVRGTLYGSIADGLYSAYVSSSVISNRSAYVVTRKRIKVTTVDINKKIFFKRMKKMLDYLGGL